MRVSVRFLPDQRVQDEEPLAVLALGPGEADRDRQVSGPGREAAVRLFRRDGLDVVGQDGQGWTRSDLADHYSTYGRKVALAEVCAALGVPVKTTATGGDVAALWEAGDRDRIRRYVLEDAVATLIVYFCWSAAKAGDEALVTRPLAALARHIEADAERAHLRPFVECDLTRWAWPKAMAADVAAALGRVQRKLEREEIERSFVPADRDPRRR